MFEPEELFGACASSQESCSAITDRNMQSLNNEALNLAQLEDVIAPWWHVQIKPFTKQFITVALIDGGAHQVLQTNRPPAHLLKRDLQIAFTLISGIVRNNKKRQLSRLVPGKTDEGVPCPVSIPSRLAIEQPPLSVANCRLVNAVEQAIIKLPYW